MAMTNAQRTWIGVLGLAATVCIAWLSWAWSPALEEDNEDAASIANDAGEAAPAPVSTAVPQHAPPAPTPATPAVQPPAPAPAAAPEASALQQPERIPTPHPMSLDQTKPPEQFGALAQLKNQYASESRSADSSVHEAKLRELVTQAPNVPSELVQGISCRRNVCKIDVQWVPRRRIGFAVVLESFKQLYNQRVAVEPAAGKADDGTYPTTLYLRLNP
jgi:hypothetical protein